MDCKVIISARALCDLEEIVRFIATDNPTAAGRFGRQLLAEAESIGGMPLAGRVVPEFKAPDIRERIFRSIRIVYRVDADRHRVVVSRFWHGARGTPEMHRGEAI
jgi:toxin ParE1/3/4